jgi:hypothetical protein
MYVLAEDGYTCLNLERATLLQVAPSADGVVFALVGAGDGMMQVLATGSQDRCNGVLRMLLVAIDEDILAVFDVAKECGPPSRIEVPRLGVPRSP